MAPKHVSPSATCVIVATILHASIHLSSPSRCVPSSAQIASSAPRVGRPPLNSGRVITPCAIRAASNSRRSATVPFALAAHRADEDQMIHCDKCAFWVHARCDGIDKEDFEKLAECEDEAYTCPNCRGERTTTLLLQILDALDKEDRDRFFAEPVSVEFAIYTQYHTVVKNPMDFMTMRNKVQSSEYGTEVHAAVAAFHADFELTCQNAMAFHRPNERCHIMARRMLRFGNEAIKTTFPWSKLNGDEGDGGETKGGKSSRSTDLGDPRSRKKADDAALIDADGNTAATAIVPVLESEWDYGAALRWECESGSTTQDVCFVCGAGPHWAGGKPEEGELLRCAHCAESFHTFCTPQPAPALTEETRLHWICQRCRPPLRRQR